MHLSIAKMTHPMRVCGSGFASTCLIITAFAIGDPRQAAALETNLAPLGTAIASRTDFGATVVAGIDGNRNGNFGNGSVFYGNADSMNPPLYYQVKLAADSYIDRVQILRRTDADQGVFGNMRLTIYDDDGMGNPGAVTFTKDYLTGDFSTGGFEFGTWGATDPGASSAQGVHGRHVRLERIDNNFWLTFAEFEVLGSASPLAFTDFNNIAKNKPVTTRSAPGFDAVIGGGNDGNIDGNFGGGGYRPVYHSSAHSVGESWQVDLGAMTHIDHMELFPRTDEGRTTPGDTNTPLYVTTSQYKVSVLDASLAEVKSFMVDNPLPSDANPQFDHLLNTAGVMGRYLRVETTQDQFLAFSELRAWAGLGLFDFNHDGSVGAADLPVWKQAFGADANGDANGDGKTDGSDFLIWQQHVGATSATAATSAAPEPTAIALASLAIVLSLRARRRRR